MYQVKGLEKKKNKYHVLIEFQGKETDYEVSEELILDYRLVTGKILDEIQFKTFMNALNNDKYRQKLMHYCTFKPRTIKEATDYLSAFKMPEKAKESLIKKLVDIHILDDQTYTKQYIQEYSSFRLIGPNKIRYDLKKKGISDALINLYIKSYTHDLIKENISKLIQKKIKSSKNKPLQKLKTSLMTYIVNKGYDYQSVKEVIESLMDHIHKNNNEEEALQKDFDNYVRKYRKSNQSQSLKAYCLPKLMQKGYSYHIIMKFLEGEDTYES